MKRLVLTAILSMTAGAAWATAPNVLTYQGRLLESGSPVSGTRTIDMQLCDSLSGGLCYDSGSQAVGVVNGVFKTTFTLATAPALPAEGLASGSWFLQTIINGVTLSPREQLTSAPYAVLASSAETLTPPSAASAGVEISTNVGIGTASPLALLHVYSGTSGLAKVIVEGGGVAGNTPVLELRGSASGSGAQLSLAKADSSGESLVDFQTGSGSSSWQLAHESAASSSRLDVNEAASGSVFPRASFARGGRVGLGTVSPRAQVEVSSASATGLDAVFIVSSGSASGQELVTVLGDGGLGVGTTAPLQASAPGARLDVRGPAALNGPLTINGGSGFSAPLSVNGDISTSGSVKLVDPGSTLVVSGGGGVNAGTGGVTTTGSVSISGGGSLIVGTGGTLQGDGSTLSNVIRTVSSTTLTSAASVMTVGPFTAVKYMRAVIHVAGVTAASDLEVQFNSDGSAIYSDARTVNGASGSDTAAADVNIYGGTYGGSAANYVLELPYNTTAVKAGTLTGADYSSGSSAPSQVQLSWVYGDATKAIDTISLLSPGGNMLAGSSIVVYGSN